MATTHPRLGDLTEVVTLRFGPCEDAEYPPPAPASVSNTDWVWGDEGLAPWETPEPVAPATPEPATPEPTATTSAPDDPSPSPSPSPSD